MAFDKLQGDDCVVHEAVGAIVVSCVKINQGCGSESFLGGKSQKQHVSLAPFCGEVCSFENCIGAWSGSGAASPCLLSCVAKRGKDLLKFWMLYVKSNVQLGSCVGQKEAGVPVESSRK